MSMTDPIADLLTRIRNANANGEKRVRAPYSSFKEAVLRILKEQGFIAGYSAEGEGAKRFLVAELKYSVDGERAIQQIHRVSKPGRRVFRECRKLPDVLNGLGIAVVSTSKGVVSNLEAKKLGLGGEVICEVW
jgi:small subunit ribosomal protein S8